MRGMLINQDKAVRILDQHIKLIQHTDDLEFLLRNSIGTVL